MIVLRRLIEWISERYDTLVSSIEESAARHRARARELYRQMVSDQAEALRREIVLTEEVVGADHPDVVKAKEQVAAYDARVAEDEADERAVKEAKAALDSLRKLRDRP